MPDLLLLLQYYGGTAGEGCVVADGSADTTEVDDGAPACLADCFVGGDRPENDEGWCSWLTPQVAVAGLGRRPSARPTARPL